jgi:hypothetical protein
VTERNTVFSADSHDKEIYKEHMRHFCLGQLERSAVAEHVMHTRHSMEFSSIHRLARVKGYMDGIVKEDKEIRLYLNDFSRDNGFMLIKTWQPIFHHSHTQ